MKSNFFSKTQIFFNSRKIFKNWHIYPKVYYNLINDEYVIFETKTNLKIKIRTDSTDLMALTNVWMINEYSIEDFQIAQNDTIIDIGAHIGLFSLLVSINTLGNEALFSDCIYTYIFSLGISI